MLRAAVIGVGVVLMLAGFMALIIGAPPAAVLLFEGAVIVLAIVCERVIYKRLETGRPGEGWVKTPERFIDDESGKPVTVYVNPKTGERKYVQE